MMTWTKMKTAMGVAAGVFIAAEMATLVVTTHGRDGEARQILGQTIDTYSQMQSYSSSGTTVDEINDSISNQITATFSMRLSRPDFHHIEYEQHASSYTNRAAVWCDGTGNYFKLYVPSPVPPGSGRSANAIKSPFTGWKAVAGNIAMTADVSGGAPTVMPGIFFGIQLPMDGLWRGSAAPQDWPRKTITKEPDEAVTGSECYVLSSEFENGRARLWIDKQDHLIRQSRQIVRMGLPEATDGEINSLLSTLPGPSPLSFSEMKRRINEGRKKASASMQRVTVVFSESRLAGLKTMTVDPPGFRTYTQTYTNIIANQKFLPSDFAR